MAASSYSFSHPDKERLEHLLSIRGDLGRAEDCIASLIDRAAMFGGGGLLAESVFTLGIVAYVRCFASGRRKGLSQEIFAARPKLLEAHNEIKTVRNQHIAHAVGVLENMRVLVAANDPTSPAQGVGALGVFFSHTQKKSTLRLFLRTVKFAMHHVDGEIERIGSALATSLLRKKITWSKSQAAFRSAIGEAGVVGGSLEIQRRMLRRAPKLEK